MSFRYQGAPLSGDTSPRWLSARVVRGTVGRVALALYRTRIIGQQHVPAGGAIVAGNHVSYGDPILLWCGAPRPVHFMTKSELFVSGLLAWALPRLWAFPVNRGAADRTAIQTATHLLQAGDLVGIFPEGTRVRQATPEGLGEAHGGVAFIAIRANVPVIPVGISGTDRIWPRGRRLPRFPRVTIRFCEPIHPEEFAGHGRKERVEAMTAEIMRRIAVAKREAEEG